MDEHEERTAPDGDPERSAPADAYAPYDVGGPPTAAHATFAEPSAADATFAEPTAAHATFAEPFAAEAPFAEPTAAHATFAAPPAPAVDTVEADDDADEDEEKHGISFATKALVVGAAWVLLVLFLIGQFSDDDDPGGGPVGLDQSGEAADGDLAAGEEAVAEEPVDVDGDGEIEPGEPGYGTASVAGAGAGGGDGSGAGGSGSGGTSAGGSSGGGSGGEEGGSGDASPVTLPGGAPAPTSTTTAKPGGGSSSSTSTTAKPGGGGGGGGGGGSSTTSPPTTTGATTATDTVELLNDNAKKCVFSKGTVGPAAGRIDVTFVNGTDQKHTIAYGGKNYDVEAGGSRTATFTSTTTVNCIRSGADDTLIVTVS